MLVTRLSRWGKIVIPKSLRTTYGWQLGQYFEVIDGDEGLLLKPLNPEKPFDTIMLEEVSGCLEYHGKAKSLNEMEAAIKQKAINLKSTNSRQ